MTTEHLPKQAQPGITDRPAEHLVLAALALRGADPVSCHAAMQRLRTAVSAELKGDPADASSETGELGFAASHTTYNLTVTLGLSTSAYQKLGAAAEETPRDLHPMPPDIVDPDSQGGQAPRPAQLPGEGDVLLKITADDIYITEHVLRRIERELSSDFSVLWTETGAQRYNTRQSKDPRKESRALIGFLDGTANLDPSNPDDRTLVFTDHTQPALPPNPTQDQYGGAQFPPFRDIPTNPEAASLDGGSYVAVEVLLLNTSDFDQQGQAAQESVIGRSKVDGTPLGGAMPSSHVKKSNPHRPGTDDEQRRFLRRGYSLIRPTGSSLTLGLIFIAYGRSLTTQHEFVRRAWIDNPNFPQVGAGPDQLLSRYVNRPLEAGGYYFVPPLEKSSDRASWRLPAPPSA